METGPAELIADLDAALLAYGEDVVFQTITVDTEGAETVAAEQGCRASVRSSLPQDLLEGQRESQVIVSPTGLGSFGVPVKDTRILIAGAPANVETIDPIRVNGVLVRVNLVCRG